ncbi:MAG TPA: carbonic anhydrase [Xanthomonadales bacterium]|nr:carbonic anhydrase [Xanthomonadales bacterium]
MTDKDETFITIVGCMDGRVQQPLSDFGKKNFDAQYADTITEAGQVGVLTNILTDELRYDLKTKIDISLDKHKSKGIVVSGHQECAGHPVDDATHIEDVRKSAAIIQDMVGPYVSVVGVFVSRSGDGWKAEEV